MTYKKMLINKRPENQNYLFEKKVQISLWKHLNRMGTPTIQNVEAQYRNYDNKILQAKVKSHKFKDIEWRYRRIETGPLGI